MARAPSGAPQRADCPRTACTIEPGKPSQRRRLGFTSRLGAPCRLTTPIGPQAVAQIARAGTRGPRPPDLCHSPWQKVAPPFTTHQQRPPRTSDQSSIGVGFVVSAIGQTQHHSGAGSAHSRAARRPRRLPTQRPRPTKPPPPANERPAPILPRASPPPRSDTLSNPKPNPLAPQRALSCTWMRLFPCQRR